MRVMLPHSRVQEQHRQKSEFDSKGKACLEAKGDQPGWLRWDAG